MDEERKRNLLWVLFAAYLLGLLLLLFFREPRVGYPYNLVPFRAIRNWVTMLLRTDPAAVSMRPLTVMNLFGNLAVLIPIGLFLPALFSRQRNFWIFLLTVTAFVCLIELAQLLSRQGALDVDDLILNVPGACLGWLLWRAFRKKKA